MAGVVTARRIAVFVFLLTLLAYVAGLSPSAYWLDSSEFAAASVLLGIPHPPWHPLAVLVGKATSLLPLGPLALRVGLAQALCAAASAALLSLLGAHLAARCALALGASAHEFPPAPALLCGAGAALATSLGYAVAFQAVRPEVYALHRLLAVLVLWGLLRHNEGDRRGLLVAAFAVGLGLANHHFLALLLLLPAAVLLTPAGDAQGLLRTVLIACLLGALALLLYVYLPLRGARHPLVNWGAPTTLGRIAWVVSARAFQKSLKEPGADDADVLGAVVEQVGPLGMVLALAGLYLLLRQGPTRRFGVYLLALIALHAGGRAVLGFDVANPDAHGYLVPAGDALALCGCAAFGAFQRLLLHLQSPRLALPGGVVLLLCGLLWGAREPGRSDRSAFWDLDVLVGGWLEEAPPRARLLSSHFQTVFGLWYLMGVEGQRPDVEHWHPHFLAYPGYREELLARLPDATDLPPLLGDNGLQLAALLESAKHRPTLFEYDLDTAPALAARLVPQGLAEALITGPDAGRRWQAQQRREVVFGRLDLGEPETRRNVFWRSYLRAALACQQGDGTSYAAELERTRRLLGGGQSPEVKQLERRCRSSPGAKP